MDLDDKDTLNNQDRIQAITITEYILSQETLDNGSNMTKPWLDAHDSESDVNYYIYVCIWYNYLHSPTITLNDIHI